LDRTMRHREANDVSDAGGEERVDSDACDVGGVERQPVDACVGKGGYEDVAPRTARADGLREVTGERERERDAMDRGKVVPERRDGIEDGFHVLTLNRTPCPGDETPPQENVPIAALPSAEKLSPSLGRRGERDPAWGRRRPRRRSPPSGAPLD
jgi:hypothetical protein